MKIGIMGGTFDPIHNGHLMLGELAYQQFHLNQVWFMPNGNPPHKNQSSIRLDGYTRAKMVEAAIQNVPYFSLNSYEIDRGKTTCSYETFAYLKETYPEHTFYFIMGADSLFQIESWVHPEKLFPNCIILAAYRDDKNKKELMEQQIQYLCNKYNASIHLLETPVMDISSTEIRDRIQKGESCVDDIPDSVYSYIVDNHLYQITKE